MSNPSDPHRHHGDDLPRDTSAFEDTEFSMDGGSARAPEGHPGEGFDAEVASSPAGPGTPDDDATGEQPIIDAESTEVFEANGGNSASDDARDADAPTEMLGSARDPEVTGIIPVVNDEQVSEYERQRAEESDPDSGADTGAATSAFAPATAAAAAGSTGGAHAAAGTDGSTGEAGNGADAADAADGGESDGGDASSHPWFLRTPPWAWILVIGAVLAVLCAVAAVGFMRTGDSQGHKSPYSSVVPSYPRPEAWDSSNPIPSAEPNSGGEAETYYEPEYVEPEEAPQPAPEENDDSDESSPAPSPTENKPDSGDNEGNNGNSGNNSGTGGGTNGGNGGNGGGTDNGTDGGGGEGTNGGTDGNGGDGGEPEDGDE